MIACVIGYFFALDQIKQFEKPDFIAFLASHNMPAPKPIDITRSIMSFGRIFSGIAAGIIFYWNIAKKCLTPLAPKVFMGIITFPFDTFAGVIRVLPSIIYKGSLLF